MVQGELTFSLDSDLNGDSPQFTLTCTSTGGPATTVTWTRDSETVSGGMTVLDDPVTAQYTHTLTVTGRLGGQYQCAVANSRPSQDSARLLVKCKYLYSTNKLRLAVSDVFSTPQWPQLPLISWQFRKDPLESASLGPHPLHWGIQLGTGSTTMVVAAVAMWMLVVVLQTTTY